MSVPAAIYVEMVLTLLLTVSCIAYVFTNRWDYSIAFPLMRKHPLILGHHFCRPEEPLI